MGEILINEAEVQSATALLAALSDPAAATQKLQEWEQREADVRAKEAVAEQLVDDGKRTAFGYVMAARTEAQEIKDAASSAANSTRRAADAMRREVNDAAKAVTDREDAVAALKVASEAEARQADINVANAAEATLVARERYDRANALIRKIHVFGRELTEATE